MCKARRQRSIWARIKLSSWKYDSVWITRIQTLNSKLIYFHFALQFSMIRSRKLASAFLWKYSKFQPSQVSETPVGQPAWYRPFSQLQKLKAPFEGISPKILKFPTANLPPNFLQKEILTPAKQLPAPQFLKPCRFELTSKTLLFLSSREVRLCTIPFPLSRTFFSFFKLFSKSSFYPCNSLLWTSVHQFTARALSLSGKFLYAPNPPPCQLKSSL